MERGFILSNVEDFSAEQLFEFICQGDVTLEELKATGNLDNTKRRAIVNLQNARDAEDDNAWNTARYTEQGCRDYLTHYPGGRHIVKARQQIDDLEKLRRDEIVERQRILEEIRHNPNSKTPGMLREYLNNGTIKRDDLINYGIPGEIVDRLNNIVQPKLTLGKTPDFIPDGYTEVYFWGIAGSGKTCALAAVLSTAYRLGYLELAQGPGYDYAVRLQNIFTNKISYLPTRTPVDNTQYLPFTLKRKNERYARSVSLIELSGEIFQCFLHKNAGNLMDPQQEHTFNSLINFLNGNNRKIHFFFVDYIQENNMDTTGYTQANYLDAAATFFNNPNYNLFRKSTDAVYIVITKSDLMDCSRSERVKHVEQYLQDKNFAGFVNSLRDKCRKNDINGKKLLGTPFSLGKVYFNEICMFDDETSNNIIDILMRRIAPQKESILDFFNN